MPKTKLVIVNDNGKMSNALQELFCESRAFEVCECAKNADEAMERFREGSQPDVALIDMMMPVCDGIGLVMRLKQEHLAEHTMLIGMSGLISDVALKLVQSIGISYVIAMPAEPESIYARVCSLLEAGLENNGKGVYMELKNRQLRERDETITRYLFAMGMSAHHDGFKYMRDAVNICIDTRERSIGLTTHVYPEIARKYGVSVNVVERSIRYAIETAWLRGSVENQYRLFGYTVKEDKGRPTNKECISLIAERTRIRMAASFKY